MFTMLAIFSCGLVIGYITSDSFEKIKKFYLHYKSPKIRFTDDLLSVAVADTPIDYSVKTEVGASAKISLDELKKDLSVNSVSCDNITTDVAHIIKSAGTHGVSVDEIVHRLRKKHSTIDVREVISSLLVNTCYYDLIDGKIKTKKAQ